MKANEKAVEILTQLGLNVSPLSDNCGWAFQYKDLNILLSNEENNETGEFLMFLVPNVIEFTDENRDDLMKICNETLLSLRYIKAFESEDHCLDYSFEHYCSNEPDEELILFILNGLAETYNFICSKLLSEEE